MGLIVVIDAKHDTVRRSFKPQNLIALITSLTDPLIDDAWCCSSPGALRAATEVVALQCALHTVCHQIGATESDLALVGDNKARSHWYPRIIFLIYRGLYYKKQTMLCLMDRELAAA